MTEKPDDGTRNGARMSQAALRRLQDHRTLIFICQVPGPSPLFYRLTYPQGNHEPYINANLQSQHKHITEARIAAKAAQPATVYVHDRQARYREVLSYPRVVNRKKAKK